MAAPLWRAVVVVVVTRTASPVAPRVGRGAACFAAGRGGVAGYPRLVPRKTVYAPRAESYSALVKIYVTPSQRYDLDQLVTELRVSRSLLLRQAIEAGLPAVVADLRARRRAGLRPGRRPKGATRVFLPCGVAPVARVPWPTCGASHVQPILPSRLVAIPIRIRTEVAVSFVSPSSALVCAVLAGSFWRHGVAVPCRLVFWRGVRLAVRRAVQARSSATSLATVSVSAAAAGVSRVACCFLLSRFVVWSLLVVGDR